MQMIVDITRLALADLSVLDRVAPNVFDLPIDASAARRFLADENHYLLVATDATQEKVIGFVSGVRQFHPDKPKPQMFINEIGVAPGYQRRGVGKALMTAILAEARIGGCELAWLATDESNAAALALYRSAGGAEPEAQVHIDFVLD